MLHWIWSNADKLAYIATIVTSSTIVFLLVILILTRRQVRLASGAAAIQVFERVFADLNSKESRKNRRFIYRCRLSPEEILTNELVHSKVESVCVSLDHVGVLLTNELLPKKSQARKIYFDMYVDVFIRCWERLKHYVEFVQDKRYPQHYRNFRNLADLAKKYWQEEFPDTSLDVFSLNKEERHQLSKGKQTLVTIIPSKKVVCDKPSTWFRVRIDEVENTQTKERFDYTVAEIGPSVGIIALDDNEKITIVGQWRHTLNKYSWEIPTGVVDGDENVLEAAKRELLEETGLIADNWIKLGIVDNSNGSTTDVGHLFLASGLTQTDGRGDPNVVIHLDSVNLWEAIELVYENKITESLSVAGILKAGHYLATQTE